MADSLLQAVKTGGQQLQMSQQDVSSLAKAAGSPIAPTTPQGVAGIGGNPDVSKMAGTPNQLANAVKQMRVNPTGGKDLATAVREAQQQSTQTAEQAALTQQAKALGGLGSLQSRVPQMIQQAYDQAAKGAGPANLQVDQTQVSSLGLKGDDATNFSQAIVTLGSQTATQAQKEAALAQAGSLYNKATGGTSTPDAAFFKSMFTQPGQDEGATLAAAVQGKMPTEVTLGQLQPSQLGFQNWGELDQLLGVKPGASQNMTVAQLGAAVQAKQSGQYNTEAQWRGILSDPTSSVNLRNTARTMLQAMGATGIDTAEASVQKLTQQVRAANTVSFFGQSMTVEQALSSQTVQGVVSQVLADPTYAAQVQQQDPEFYNWVQTNSQELSAAYSGISETQKDVATATASYQAQWSALDASTQQALGYQSGLVVDPNSAPKVPETVAGLSKLGQQDQATVAGVLQQVAAQATGGGPGAQAAQSALQAIASVGTQAILNQGAGFDHTLETALNTSSGTMSAQSYVTAATGTMDPAMSENVSAAQAAQVLGLGVTMDPALSAMMQGTPAAQAAAIAKLSPSLTDIVSTLQSGGVVGPSFGEQLASASQDFSNAVTSFSPIKTSAMKAMAANISAGKGATFSSADIGNLVTEANGTASDGDLSSFDDLEHALQASGAPQSQLAQITWARDTAAGNYVNGLLSSNADPTSGFGGGSLPDFLNAVKANTDYANAGKMLTTAQQALKAAQTHRADSSIIQNLQSAVTAAQSQVTVIQQGHQAVVNSMAPTAGKMDSQANKQVGANPGGNPLQRASSGGVAGAVRQAKKLF